jgi:hypothetical protein
MRRSSECLSAVAILGRTARQESMRVTSVRTSSWRLPIPDAVGRPLGNGREARGLASSVSVDMVADDLHDIFRPGQYASCERALSIAGWA